MCTVTFVPFANNQFILTQNRDEGFNRPAALSPKIYKQPSYSLLYPKDPVGEGTWMATSDRGLTACLLNGAFEKHKRQLPYSKSRGLILLDLFRYQYVEDFTKNYLLENIEPFTIIAVDKMRNGYVLIWDETTFHCTEFDTDKHHIWSSSTLYTNQQKDERHGWFLKKIKEEPFKDSSEIISFHLTHENRNQQNSILMKRENVGTVSITSVKVTANEAEMNYIDLQNRVQSKLSISQSVLDKSL